MLQQRCYEHPQHVLRYFDCDAISSTAALLENNERCEQTLNRLNRYRLAERTARQELGSFDMYTVRAIEFHGSRMTNMLTFPPFVLLPVT
jgi:hypothetical protein